MSEPTDASSAGAPPAVLPERRDPISTARVLVAGLAGATFIALSVTAQTYLSMLGHGHSFSRMLWWQLGVAGIWALLAPTLLRLGVQAHWHTARPIRAAVAVASWGLLAITIHLSLAAALSLWLQPFVPERAAGFEAALRAQFEAQFATDVLTFAMLVVIGRTIAVNDHARRLALRESKLEAELARANLEALRLEIQPHFLFNTLNSIAALIRMKANDKALEMLLGLGSLMRATVDRPPDHLTPLATEVEFARQYLALQSARYGDRLGVQFDVDDECLPILVPSFLLQPIVENSLRHGVGRRTGRVRVAIAAHRDGDTLHVSVEDDGVGLPPGFTISRDAGTGLRNISTRLQQLFGERGTLRLASAQGGGTRVDVAIPIREADALARETA